MKDYHDMIDEVLTYGTRKENRTGVDTISTFNYNYELTWDERLRGSKTTYVGADADGNPRIPLLTTKKISWKNIVIELLWFLSGEPKIDILQRHGCKFWDAWADEEGNVPMAYGEQWRRFPVHVQPNPGDTPHVGINDQIQYALNTLRKSPMSRRVVVSAWAPQQAQTAALPPCHMLFVFNVQNVEGEDGKTEQRLCLHLTQRSADLLLGIPYNIASYSLLLLIMSHLTGIKPGIFAHSILDLHIYTGKPDGSMAEYDHIPGAEEQRSREPRPLPTLTIDPSIKELSDIEALMGPDTSTSQILEAFKLQGYNPHPAIPFKVAV